MKASSTELANRISRALISSASKNPTRYSSWTPSLESLLHRQLGRNSLSPSLVARVIDPHLLNHHSLALGFFNWASQQPSFSHDQTTYHSVLKSLSFSRQNSSTAAIEALLKRVRAQKITLDISIYRSVIASLIAAKKTHNAYMVFRDVKDQILDIGPRICNSLLAGLASDGYDGYAQKVFDEMRERNVALSTIGFGVYVMSLCGGNVEVRVVLSVLDEVRRGGNSEINGSVIAVLIVHGLCKASKTAEALWVLDELRMRGDCKPDFMAYRIVAEAIRATGDVVETDKVLKKKRKLGVAPRSNDYREFIFGLVSERRIREAKEIGEVIVSGNFPIEDDVLNVLIGSVSATDPRAAMVFFRFMVGKARYPTLLTLSNLCRNLIKHSSYGELLVEVFQALSSGDYFKDLDTYNVMVSFLCKAGMVKEAYGVLSEMKKRGLRPDISTYNSLVEACCREDLLRPAKRLWDEMFADGCRGNLTTYNTLICKFSKVGQVDEALRLFYHMLSRREVITPDVMTYTSLLEGLCQEAKLQAALEVFDKCVEQDLTLARTILSTFILFLCKADHFCAAAELLSGLSFDIAQSDSHVVLLKCLSDAKEIPIATEHIKWIRQNSLAMWQTVSNELASISSSPKPEPFLELLQTFR